MPDMKLTQDPITGLFDISFKNGDLEVVDSFDTALIVSIFTNARADSSEMPVSQLQRGWWGDTVSDDQTLKIGSKFWLLEQARLTNTTLNMAISYITLALNWLITYEYSKSVNVTGAFINGGIEVTAKIVNANSKTESRSYKLWQNTGELNAH